MQLSCSVNRNLDNQFLRKYIGSMKIKTSITLSEDLLKTIDHLPTQYRNRSFFLETAAWAFIAQLRRAEQAARDLEIIERRADYLNEEVMDALAYQVAL
jgi:metal-responsive CopG/Arc/MetJ family transcriptional regulator